MEKVLITGGAGFIGNILVKKLLDKNYKVTILDNFRYNQLVLDNITNPNLEVVIGDVRDKKLLREQVLKNDIIIPLAAMVGAPACDKYPIEAKAINYQQIEDIVYYADRNKYIIYPNTNSSYGSSKDIITESSPFKPLSLYAETKCKGEQIILDESNGTILRLATVFGISGRPRLDLLVNDFTYKAFTDGYLVLFESHFKRNYIHIEDVANTFIFMIENYDKCNSKIYNVGLSSANLSKMELALKIKEYVPNLVIKEEEFMKDKDQRNYIVSNERLEATGWRPTKTIDDGIKEILKACPMIKKYRDKDFTNL